MPINVSIFGPNAFSIRIAMSPLRSTLALSNQDRAWRDTPSTLAALVTLSPLASMISVRITSPGCGGLYIGLPSSCLSASMFSGWVAGLDEEPSTSRLKSLGSRISAFVRKNLPRCPLLKSYSGFLSNSIPKANPETDPPTYRPSESVNAACLEQARDAVELTNLPHCPS